MQNARFAPLLAPLGMTLLLAACSDPDAGSRSHSESGIFGPNYDAIADELRDLASQHADMAKVLTYGKSVRGRDLTMIRIGRADFSVPGGEKRPAVIITGTIHGDEFLNIENRLPRWFLENQASPGVAKYLASGGLIYVAPILNPDGYEARQRGNRTGQDLNRDFDLKMINKRGFAQPETRSLATILREEQTEQRSTYSLTLDYHCCVGALIYPWGHSQTAEMPAAALTEHKRLAKLMLGNFPGYGAGQAYDIVGYTSVGASDDYFHETFGASSFTFEGAYRREDDNFDRHTVMWDQLLADKAGKTIVTPNAAGPLTLALFDAGATVKVGVAAGRAEAMAICRGAVTACRGSSADIVARFSTSRTRGDRVIFGGDLPFALVGGELLTVLALDGAGVVTGSLGVRIEPGT